MNFKPKKPRCPVCNKKMGLMVFKCKCEIRFCIAHSCPELHDCNYDHKTYERNKLQKKLIQVKGDKVIRI